MTDVTDVTAGILSICEAALLSAVQVDTEKQPENKAVLHRRIGELRGDIKKTWLVYHPIPIMLEFPTPTMVLFGSGAWDEDWHGISALCQHAGPSIRRVVIEVS